MLHYYIIFSVVLTTMLLMLFFGVIFYAVAKEVNNYRKWFKILKSGRRYKK